MTFLETLCKNVGASALVQQTIGTPRGTAMGGANEVWMVCSGLPAGWTSQWFPDHVSEFVEHAADYLPAWDGSSWGGSYFIDDPLTPHLSTISVANRYWIFWAGIDKPTWPRIGETYVPWLLHGGNLYQLFDQ